MRSRRMKIPRVNLNSLPWDGLPPHLTPTGNTEITKCIQRCPHALIGIIGMGDRDRLERLIGIAGMLTCIPVNR